MLRSLLNRLFRCRHNRTTFPMTPRSTSATANSWRHGMYVACLDCGQRLSYNWDEMCIVESLTSHSLPPLENPSRWTISVLSDGSKEKSETRRSPPRHR